MQKYRAIVTGVSRGLGKDVLKLILQNKSNYEVIGTVRKGKDELKNQLDLQFPNNLAQILILDLSNKQSISNFGKTIKEKGFYFDCLINNAALSMEHGSSVPSVQVAQITFQTNLLGTIYLTEQLLPMLKENGRIINVSSKLGGLVNHGGSVIQKFNNQNITVEDMKKEMNTYLIGCMKGNLGNYYTSAYGTSKMMLNAWSRYILKKKLKKTQVAIAMSPGHCKTDMGTQMAPRTCLEGAISIYRHINGNYSSDIFYHTNDQTNYMDCS